MTIRAQDLPESVRKKLGIKVAQKHPDIRIGSASSGVLVNAVLKRWPGAKPEHLPVPGRKFRTDIAFPEHRLAVEIDGWQYHGRFKSSFEHDRKRQNLMVLHGWRVLRFFHREILHDLDSVLEQIAIALKGESGGGTK